MKSTVVLAVEIDVVSSTARFSTLRMSAKNQLGVERIKQIERVYVRHIELLADVGDFDFLTR